MSKKRLDITIDSEIYDALEQIRFEPRFRPSLSEIVNSLLKSHPEIKKKLKKNVKS